VIEILMATYNGSKFIGDQIESLFVQTNQDWVLIIHDDGSIDNTLEKVKLFQVTYPNRIVIIEDGIVFGNAKDNFFHLIKSSSAQYIMFCDQDDVWLEDKVQITFNAMQNEEQKFPKLPILIHTDLTIVDDQLNIIADSMFQFQRLPTEVNFLEQLLVRNNVTGCTMMINKTALECAQPISSKAMMHDWWIALKVTSHGGKIRFLDKPTILYRQHGNNGVGAVKVNALYFYRKLLLLLCFKSNLTMSSVITQAKEIDGNVSVSRLILIKMKEAMRIMAFKH